MKHNTLIDKNELQTNEKSKPANLGFLKSRDNDFDAAKSFLIISMVVAHSVQRMWDVYYNRNLTYYVTFGFIFLAGLTLGSTFFDKILSNRKKLSWQVFSRGLKLFVIFLCANIILMLMSPNLMDQFLNSETSDILFALIHSTRGTDTIYYSFLILVPISLMFMIALSLLFWKNRTLDWVLLIVGYAALWGIETTGILNYYAPKLLIVGCIAILLSKLLACVNWIALRVTLSKWVILVFICYIAYQAALLVYNPDADLLTQHYIIVTALILLAVYLTSFRLNLTSYRIVALLNRGLAKYMLFAYLFHIILLVIVGKFVSRGNWFFAMAIGLLTLLATLSAGLAVDVLTKKSKTINKIYALIFK